MIRTALLATALFAATQLPAQQTTQPPPLPMAGRSLTFTVANFGPFDIHGEARGQLGLDYSAGASVSVTDAGPVLHRVILDRTHHLFFGYDLLLQPGDDSAHVRLHFAPLSDIRGFGFDRDAFRPADMATPEDRVVLPGDPTEVVLEQGTSGTVKLRDLVTLLLR